MRLPSGQPQAQALSFEWGNGIDGLVVRMNFFSLCPLAWIFYFSPSLAVRSALSPFFCPAIDFCGARQFAFLRGPPAV